MSGRSVPDLLSAFFGGDAVTTDSLKLILEYRAIQEIDRILQRSGTTHETELIGLRARVIRRQEILRQLTALARVADGVPSNDCPMKHEESDGIPIRRNGSALCAGEPRQRRVSPDVLSVVGGSALFPATRGVDSTGFSKRPLLCRLLAPLSQGKNLYLH